MESASRPFVIHGVNHIGLAPKDPDKTRWFLGTILGLNYLGEELVLEQQTLTKMFGSLAKGVTTCNEARLEILVPTTSSSPISKFHEKKGSGLHHLALTVNNVQAAITYLTAQGVKMIDTAPRHGAHETLIAFVHPESTGGLLIELVQEKI